MTAVLTAFELHGQMVERAGEVDAAVKEYRKCAIDYAAAKGISEKNQALAFPKTKGTVDERRSAVMTACSDYYFAELQADALRNGADRALKAAMAQLSALQSMAAALREELRLGRTDNYS